MSITSKSGGVALTGQAPSKPDLSDKEKIRAELIAGRIDMDEAAKAILDLQSQQSPIVIARQDGKVVLSGDVETNLLLNQGVACVEFSDTILGWAAEALAAIAAGQVEELERVGRYRKAYTQRRAAGLVIPTQPKNDRKLSAGLERARAAVLALAAKLQGEGGAK